MKYTKAFGWLKDAIASPVEISTHFKEAMGFYMTSDAAYEALRALDKRPGMSFNQLGSHYKRLLAAYLGTTKDKLTNEAGPL